MLDATEQRIIACCNALMDDTLELTSDLVRGYSVLGQEQGALDTMEHHLERLGLPVTRVPWMPPALRSTPIVLPPNGPALAAITSFQTLTPARQDHI